MGIELACKCVMIRVNIDGHSERTKWQQDATTESETNTTVKALQENCTRSIHDKSKPQKAWFSIVVRRVYPLGWYLDVLATQALRCFCIGVITKVQHTLPFLQNCALSTCHGTLFSTKRIQGSSSDRIAKSIGSISCLDSPVERENDEAGLSDQN